MYRTQFSGVPTSTKGLVDSGATHRFTKSATVIITPIPYATSMRRIRFRASGRQWRQCADKDDYKRKGHLICAHWFAMRTRLATKPAFCP